MANCIRTVSCIRYISLKHDCSHPCSLCSDALRFRHNMQGTPEEALFLVPSGFNIHSTVQNVQNTSLVPSCISSAPVESSFVLRSSLAGSNFWSLVMFWSVLHTTSNQNYSQGRPMQVSWKGNLPNMDKSLWLHYLHTISASLGMEFSTFSILSWHLLLFWKG